MSTITKRKKIFSEDPPEIHREVEERCSELGRNVEFTTGELLRHLKLGEPSIDEGNYNLIYTWKNAGIITPGTGTRGKQSVPIYSFDQIKRATMAAYLWAKNIPPSEIAGVVAFWADPELVETKGFSMILDEIDRAWLWIASRMLAAVAGLSIGEGGPPPNCALILRPVSDELKDLYDASGITIRTRDKLPKLIPGRMIIGYTGKRREAEVISRIKGFQDILPRLKNLAYFSVVINNPKHLSSPYEIVFGISPDSDFSRARILARANTSGIQLASIQTKKMHLLCQLLNFMFDVVIDLPAKLSSEDPRFHLQPRADHMDVMATAAVLADSNWSSSVFYVKGAGEVLRPRCYSPEYRLQEDAALPLDPEKNLVSWVYETGDAIIIEDVQNDDPRIPASGIHMGSQPFAMIPATSSLGVEGILYVSGQTPRRSNETIFESKNALLHLLASIIGEANVRQRMADTTHMVEGVEITQEQYPGMTQLRLELEQVLIDHVATSSYNVDDQSNQIIYESFAFFAIRVEASVNFVQYWYDNQVSDLVCRYLRSKFNSNRFSNAFDNIKLFRVSSGRIVAFVKSFNRTAEFDDIRAEIQGKLAKMSEAHKSIDVHLWSVQYYYRILGRLLQEQRPLDLESVGVQVSSIIGHVKRALRNARVLSDADIFFKQQRYQEAISLYYMGLAGSDDGYIYRHLSDGHGKLGEWSKALEHANNAIRTDRDEKLPGYAGSYLRLARALIGNTQINLGLKEFDRVSKLSEEPRYQLACAEALIQYGDDLSSKEAYELLGGLLRKQDLSNRVKSWIYYLRSKAAAKSEDFNIEHRREALKMALFHDKNNQYAKWDLMEIDVELGQTVNEE